MTWINLPNAFITSHFFVLFKMSYVNEDNDNDAEGDDGDGDDEDDVDNDKVRNKA